MASRKPAARAASSTTRQQRPAGASGSGSAARSSGNGTARAGSAARSGAARSGASRNGASRNGASGSGGTAAKAGKPATAGKQDTTANARPAPAGETAARGTAAPAARPSPGGIRGLLGAPARKMGTLPLITLLLSVYGLGASVYLTIAHYDTGVRLACADTGIVNCQAVTTSNQSVVFGIFPVAVLGLAFYVFMVAVNSPWGWRLAAARPAVRWLRLGSVIVGMGFVLYLVYVELIQLNAICLWCTSVHVATFLIFALLVFREAFASSPAAPARR